MPKYWRVNLNGAIWLACKRTACTLKCFVNFSMLAILTPCLLQSCCQCSHNIELSSNFCQNNCFACLHKQACKARKPRSSQFPTHLNRIYLKRFSCGRGKGGGEGRHMVYPIIPFHIVPVEFVCVHRHWPKNRRKTDGEKSKGGHFQGHSQEVVMNFFPNMRRTVLTNPQPLLHLYV